MKVELVEVGKSALVSNVDNPNTPAPIMTILESLKGAIGGIMMMMKGLQQVDLPLL